MRSKEPTTPPVARSPFNIFGDARDLTIPLQGTFRFVHEPLDFAKAIQFVGRQNELESLAERILFSEGGSFLVTGYRGVGKTSFVNQVIRKLEEALPWAEPVLGEIRILDIYLNVARPVQPSELMHHILRRLHSRLVERGMLHLLEPDLRDSLALACQRTSMNMARKLAESSEHTFGLTDIGLGTTWFKLPGKLGWNAKRSRTSNLEMSFLGYDDKAAEHDVIALSRRLALGYPKPLGWWGKLGRAIRRSNRSRVQLKIVFVFDELDKLEEFTAKSLDGDGAQKPVIDQILGSLKNLFTTSGVSFVFVAGKDLQERWLEDVGRGDSVYESVFAYDKYLPCLWADADSITDGLIERSQEFDPHKAQVFGAFKRYLAYRGRGIPRRIIRTFNEFVEWDLEQPVLAFTRQSVRKVRFFAGLQDLIDANQKTLFGESQEEAQGTQSDKRRLGVYYLIDWILRRGSAEFMIRDVLGASARLSTKIALAEEIAPSVAEEIVKILLDADYIQAVQRASTKVVLGADGSEQRRYRVAPRRLVEMGGQAALADLEPGPLSSSDDALGRQDRVPKSIGPFQIIREIAKGGMSVVYEVINGRNGRRMALKVLSEAMSSPDLAARFEREAMVLNELNHPNIVRLYDWGREEGQPYLAMELLDGVTLEEVVRRRGRLAPDMAAAIVEIVARAAQYVHGRGFVRNDIKPSNIMLTSDGRVCLLDFGISRPKSQAQLPSDPVNTDVGVVVGTPKFMAPEQWLAGAVDERADIYSLGVVFYRLLTGEYPFEEGESYKLIKAQLEGSPAPLSRYATVPADVEQVVGRCLEKNPEDRYQSMTELAEALISASRGEIAGNVRDLVAGVRDTAKAQDLVEFAVTGSIRAAPEPGTARRPVQLPQAARQDAAPQPPTLVPSMSAFAPAGDDPSQARPHGPFLEALPGNPDTISGNGVNHITVPLENRMTIGRSSENSVVLYDGSVSRYHTVIEPGDHGAWVVEDANSVLGTFVNGERLVSRQVLHEGDEIRIGAFGFVFRTDVSPRTNEAVVPL